MAKLISKTYGDALFELAVEEDKIDVLLEEIEQLQNILAQNEDFGKLMNLITIHNNQVYYLNNI